MPPRTAKRDCGIDTLRALAIFMVVVYHAIVGAPPGVSSLYREFESLIRYIPLEIFTALSGYLYAMRRFERGNVGRMLQVKARRLLIPLITMTTLLLLMRAVLPGASTVPAWRDIVFAFAFRFEHLWYLQALFLIFVVMAIIDGYDLIQTWRSGMILTLGWWATSLVLPLNQFFGYAGLVQLMPYFLFGYVLRRWPELLQAHGVTPLAWICFLGGMTLEQLDFHNYLPLSDLIAEKWGVLNLIAGCAFCFLAVRYRRDVPGVGKVGTYSFSIYIFHTVGMAIANRVASLTPWQENFDGLVALKVFLGMFLPIALEIGIRRSTLLSTLFLGDPWKLHRPPFLSKSRAVTTTE